MSKTVYVDCNRLNSIDKDSNNPAQWTYPLRSTLDIPAGSEIQIQNSFINQKGILGSSIEIEEDIYETIQYYCYLTEEKKTIPIMVVENEIGWMDGLITLGDEFLHSVPTTQADVGYIANRMNMGGSQLPMIVYDVHDVGSAETPKTVLPRYLSKEIWIKKGVYGINQLAELITDQINGLKTVRGVPTNPLDLQLSNQEYAGNMCDTGSLSSDVQGIGGYGETHSLKGGCGLTTTIGCYHPWTQMGNTTLILNEFKELGKGYILVDAYRHQTIVDNVCDDLTGTITPVVDWDGGIAGTSVLTTACTGLILDNQVNAPDKGSIHGATKKTQAEFLADINDFRLGKKNYTVGAPQFAISFDSDRNGYTINNLHMDNICTSNDILGFPQPLSGQIIVEMRNPAELTENGAYLLECSLDGPTSPAAKLNRPKLNSGLSKPISKQGGALIYNFAYDTAKRFGDRTRLQANQIGNDNWKFKNYFTTEQLAKTAWAKTLWSRLGFSYEQLNNEEYFEELTSFNKTYKSAANPLGFRFGGVTTDATIDISIIPSISTLTNPNVVTTTADKNDPVALSPFSSTKSSGGYGSNSPLRTMRGTQVTNDNIASYRGSSMKSSTVDLVQSRPKPIVAEKLPTLSHFGYYLVSSNIVAENDDIVQKGTPFPLLGVIPKSSLSSQDFITSENDIVHVTTNPQKINNIKVSIYNPDLTQPSLDDASSVILKITMPIIEPPIKKK